MILKNSSDKACAGAFGAWAIGSWLWGGSDESDAGDAIHAAIDAGINLIDTTRIYGFGKSESLAGKAIADRRNKVLVATKCGLRWDCEDARESASSRPPFPESKRPSLSSGGCERVR